MRCRIGLKSMLSCGASCARRWRSRRASSSAASRCSSSTPPPPPFPVGCQKGRYVVALCGRRILAACVGRWTFGGCGSRVACGVVRTSHSGDNGREDQSRFTRLEKTAVMSAHRNETFEILATTYYRATNYKAVPPELC